MATKYYVPDGKGKRFSTTSIVKARAYAVKFLENNPRTYVWYIYTDKTTNYPAYYIQYFGKPAGYGFGRRSFEGSRFVYIFKNGKIRTGAAKFVGGSD